jgi:hypothetical protein
MDSPGIVDAGTVEGSNNLEPFIEFAVGEEPSRRLAQGKSAPHEERGEYDLEGDG